MNTKKKKRGHGRPFAPGNPGKPKGTKTRFTNLKQAFLAVFEDLGGADGLIAWVKASPKNKGDFYRMLARMLPADLNITEDRQDRRVIVIGKYEDPDNPKVLCGQAELDALGNSASPELQALQTRNRE